MSPAQNTDPYDRIIENMRTYPNDIPMVNGEVSQAFREYIQLLFTPEEAEIAQYLRVKPAPSRKIAQKILARLLTSKFLHKVLRRRSVKKVAQNIGKSMSETEQILAKMTDQGIIQDIGGYNHFLTMPHLFNIGFKYSKALERLGKKGAELYKQFFIEERFYRRYQSSDMGTPMTRIVPVGTSIDHQSEIRNAEEIHQLLDSCREPIVITDCPCRNRTEILGTRECKDKYPIQESCFQVGLFGEYFLNRGEGRRLTRKEAHQLADDYAKLGLIFTTENTRDKNRFVICCCCDCCCALIRGMTRFEIKNENCSAKSNYVAVINHALCKECGLCKKRCVFNAITFLDKRPSLNADQCYGCGLCAVTCPTGAVRLHRKERSPIYANGLELCAKIYRENRSKSSP